MRRDAGVFVVVVLAVLAAAAPAAARPLRVLATGDSMLLLTDRYLKRSLQENGTARVAVDIHVATGITKPQMLDWPRLAAQQAARQRPDLVIASLGANDGFPIRGVRCCSARWVARYATRLRRLNRAWLRGGRARVYWVTLPAPDSVPLGRQFDAVNAAMAQAAAGLPGVGVVDIRPVLTPAGFRPRMAIDGVEQQVRSDDGVHLWWPGARIAASIVLDRLRADGVIPPPAR